MTKYKPIHWNHLILNVTQNKQNMIQISCKSGHGDNSLDEANANLY